MVLWLCTLICSLTDQLPIQMLDALLMMYVDIPEKMNPGVSVSVEQCCIIINTYMYICVF